MLRRNQAQKAGANSQQIQVLGDLVTGVTEDRARAICNEIMAARIDEFAAEGQRLAHERIASTGDALATAMSQENLLEVFADPAFQALLGRTRMVAASISSEDEADLLVRLLVERARQDTPRARLVIERSIEIVDRLDPTTAAGLTALWVTMKLQFDNFGTAQSTLDAYERFHLKIFGPQTFPAGSGWLDELDILDCIRRGSSGLGGLKPYLEVMQIKHPYFFAPGVDADGHQAASEALREVRLEATLMPHSLVPGRYTVGVGNSRRLGEFISAASPGADVDAAVEAIQAACGLTGVSSEASAAFDREMTERVQLNRVRTLWDGIADGLNLTLVGQAIAYSTAKRWDPLEGLPRLIEYLST